jgi:hypothetical protein
MKANHDVEILYLLPCPFCEGIPHLVTNHTGWPVAQCDECGAQGPCTEVDKLKAIAAWNVRPAEGR